MLVFFSILCSIFLHCQCQIINSNITSFVELNLEIEIKVEEENTTLGPASLAPLSKEDISSAPGFFALTSVEDNRSTTLQTTESPLLIEAVEAEVYDNDDSSSLITNTIIEYDQSTTIDDDLHSLSDISTVKTIIQTFEPLPTTPTKGDNGSDVLPASNIPDKKSEETYYRISLVQLLFFIIFILVLLGSCCSVNAICLLWHQTERRVQNAILRLLREKYENNNKQHMDELKNKNVEAADEVPRLNGGFSKHKMTRDFVKNTLESYDEELIQEKRKSQLSREMSGRGSLFSQDSTMTLNLRLDDTLDDGDLSDTGTETIYSKGKYLNSSHLTIHGPVTLMFIAKYQFSDSCNII